MRSAAPTRPFTIPHRSDVVALPAIGLILPRRLHAEEEIHHAHGRCSRDASSSAPASTRRGFDKTPAPCCFRRSDAKRIPPFLYGRDARTRLGRRRQYRRCIPLCRWALGIATVARRGVDLTYTKSDRRCPHSCCRRSEKIDPNDPNCLPNSRRPNCSRLDCKHVPTRGKRHRLNVPHR
jgi:hypothetical protein